MQQAELLRHAVREEISKPAYGAADVDQALEHVLTVHGFASDGAEDERDIRR